MIFIIFLALIWISLKIMSEIEYRRTKREMLAKFKSEAAERNDVIFGKDGLNSSVTASKSNES